MQSGLVLLSFILVNVFIHCLCLAPNVIPFGKTSQEVDLFTNPLLQQLPNAAPFHRTNNLLLLLTFAFSLLHSTLQSSPYSPPFLFQERLCALP